MVSAMAELRLPLETAEAFCEGVGENSGESAAAEPGRRVAVTFSDFVERYADASGLLRETASSGGKKRGREVWVEGHAGAWVAVPAKECKGARRVFDGQVATRDEDQDQENKSDDGGMICYVPQRLCMVRFTVNPSPYKD